MVVGCFGQAAHAYVHVAQVGQGVGFAELVADLGEFGQCLCVVLGGGGVVAERVVDDAEVTQRSGLAAGVTERTEKGQ